MRFLRLRFPEVTRVLVVESGSRHLVEAVLPRLRSHFGERVPFDLVTCYTGLPAGLDTQSASVYRIHEFRGRHGRRRLYRELRTSRPAVLVMICSGEPIMAKWKWALAFRLPVKVLVVNENADYFWFDRGNWKVIRRFTLLRAGLSGGNAVHTVGRILVFPLTLTYLLLYAAVIHLRRKVRV
jgi:hypothetical protein